MPLRVALASLLLVLTVPVAAQTTVLFQASFDSGRDADRASGDGAARVHGNVPLAPGLRGQAVMVGSGHGYLTYGTEGNISAQTGTVEFWVKPVDWEWTDTSFFVFFSTELTRPEKALQVYKYVDPGILIYYGGDATNPDFGKRDYLAPNVKEWKADQWHQIAIAWDGRRMYFYGDGESLGSREIINYDPELQTGSYLPLGETFSIGTPGSNGNALMDELTIYRGVLPPGEIKQRYLDRVGGDSQEPLTFAMTAPLGGTAPELDGVIEQTEWADASAINGFMRILQPDVEVFPSNNRMLLKSDGRFLYMGLISQNLDDKPLTIAPGDGLDTVFADDCYEIMLSPDGSRIFKYEIGAGGKLAHRWGLTLRDATDARAAVSVRDGRFTAELKVPLQEIEVQGAEGARFGLLAIRSYKNQRQDLYAALPWATGFWDPKTYGEIRIVPAGRQARANISLRDLLRGTVAVDAKAGPAHAGQATVRVRAVDVGGVPVLEQSLPIKPEGVHLTGQLGPGFVGRLTVDVAGELHTALPFRVAAPLTADYEVHSDRNLMRVLLDVSGLPAEPAELAATITVRDEAGKESIRQSVPKLQTLREKVDLDLRKLPHGRQQVTCTVRNRAGQTLGETTFPVRIFKHLEGVPNRIGISDKAPPPFTPVKVTDGTFSVWGRDYVFGDSILPRQVHVLGDDVLAGPVLYEVTWRDGRRSTLSAGRLNVTDAREGHVLATAVAQEGKLKLTHRLRLEFDGMMRFDVEASGTDQVSRLDLRIPMKREFAGLFQAQAWKGKHIQHVPVTRVTDDLDWHSNNLYPCMWLTSIDKGLSWFAGTDRTWVVDRDRPRLAADPDGMRITFLNSARRRPGQLSFTYGLQAFPSRPPRADHRQFGTFEKLNWAPFFVPGIGIVPLEQYMGETEAGWDQLLAEKRAWMALGGLLLPYANFPRSVEEAQEDLPPTLYEFGKRALPQALQSFKENGYEYAAPYLTPTYSSDATPEWRYFWSEWEAQPRHAFPTWREPRASVRNEAYRDYFLYNLQRLVQRYGIKGLFHDMAGPYADEGPPGTAGYSEDGVLYDEFPLWETRDVFKRIYTMHRELYPDAMSFMNYGYWTPPVHSFTDFLLMAEDYLGTIERTIYEHEYSGSIETFSMLTAPYAGPKPMVLSWPGGDSRMDLRADRAVSIHMYGLVLLHDATVYIGRCHGDVRVETGLLKRRFGLAGEAEPIEFIPYWKAEQRIYTTPCSDVRVSFYRRADGGVMGIAVNTTGQSDVTAPLGLDLAALGIQQVREVVMFDPTDNTYTPQEHRVEGGRLLLDLPVARGLYKAILINRPDTAQ